MKKIEAQIQVKDVKIIIGEHLSKSHVYIEGKELRCTRIVIDVGQENMIPKVTLETYAEIIETNTAELTDINIVVVDPYKIQEGDNY